VVVKMEQRSKAFELLKPSIFLAGMLAREGAFPPSYLDGFERLIEDTMCSFSDSDFPQSERDIIRRDVEKIVSAARLKAGLE